MSIAGFHATKPPGILASPAERHASARSLQLSFCIVVRIWLLFKSMGSYGHLYNIDSLKLDLHVILQREIFNLPRRSDQWVSVITNEPPVFSGWGIWVQSPMEIYWMW